MKSKTILAVLSGIFIGTSYIPFPPWALFFCFLPLWGVWTKEITIKQVLLTGWITQFVLTLIGFHWVAHVAVEFGQMPQVVGYLVLLLFCATANLHIPIAGAIWHKYLRSSHPVLSLVSLALLTWLIELVYPQIFPWHFGYPWLWAKLPGYQFADVIGFNGLSLITLLVNASLLVALQKRSYKMAGVLLLELLVFNIAGHFWAKRLPVTDKQIEVLIVQANIGNFEKFMAEQNTDFRAPVIQKYFELTRRALNQGSQAELVLWPETAFPANLHTSAMGNYYQSQLKAFITSLDKDFLIGGYTDDPQTGQYFNSIYYFDRSSENRGVYHKSHLLAFGEYFPLSDTFPFLKTLIPAVSDFGRGSGPDVISHNELKIGPQVCYEGLFPDFSKGLSNKGAQVFFNVTNDSWFGHTFESYQHLYMTLARAVEFRRPLVRSTNTGISTAVSREGVVSELSPQKEEWFKSYVVQYESSPQQTPYATWSFWLLPLLTLLSLIGIKLYHVRKS